MDMYKIVQGHVELYTGYGTEKEVLLGIIGPQSCFGEFGLLLQKPAIYTVIAYDEVYALRVTEGDMGDFVQENRVDGKETKDFSVEKVTSAQVKHALKGYAVYHPNNLRRNLQMQTTTNRYKT